MSSETKIEDLFQKWNELNTQAGVSLGSFNFDSIKKVRNQQRELEDKIYVILQENAPNDIKKLLPDDCGEFEIGYNVSDKIFYFLMYDPDEDDEIIAITIDANKTVGKIKNFKMDEDEDE